MTFHQAPPTLGNTYAADRLLQEYLARTLPPAVLEATVPTLSALGALAGGRLREQQLAERHLEPRLVAWDAWGQRVDRIEPTPLWREAAELAARHGLVATAYERRHGEWSRVVQFASVYVLEPSLDVYSCPLAMSDGAARTLLEHRNEALVARAVPRLTSRDPSFAWTSGQWMTERAGGSDVGLTETVARRTPEGWRLHGAKWFSSATASEMALALARPEGNPPNGSGLALFYLELRDEAGRPNGVFVNRLKDKLGTRKLPTAELTLDGALAVPVAGLSDGVRAVVPMLNVTRAWNAIVAAAGMERGLQLARDYARRRVAFGAPLARKPLHVDTLAALEAEREGHFLLAFRVAELMGRREAGVATESDRALLRAVTPLAKLTTGKGAVAIASEVLELFGGAGYIEDTGLPQLLRDAQVLPIWEGTTNVLALDLLRALEARGASQALDGEIVRLAAEVREPTLRAAVDEARRVASAALAGLDRRPEAAARRVALTLGRSLALALLAAHAQWALDAGHGPRAAAAARRLHRHGIDLLGKGGEPEDAALLADPAYAG